MHRATSASAAVSTNYLTGKVKQSTDSTDGEAQETWRELRGPRRVCIDAIDDGLYFTPD